VRCLFIGCRLDSALKLLKHYPQMKSAQRPTRARRPRADFLKMISVSSRLDLRTQEAVKELEAPNERGVKTL
jgi:hypothetical protein